MCADRLPAARWQSAGAYESGFELAVVARTAGCVNVRGVGLNMANNPKKVKDPTEVALSAIQEALNISGAGANANRGSLRSDVALTGASATSDFGGPAFDTRPNIERSLFDTADESRPGRRAANDDRETIGQILQAIQKGRPARSVYALASLFAAVW